MRRVVVTGIGLISAIGNSPTDFFQSLITCKSGSDLIRGLPRDEIETQVAAQVSNFDASKYFAPQQIGILDRFSQFALASAGDAMKESGYSPTGEESERFAVSIGTGLGGMETTERTYQKFYGESNHHVHPFTLPKVMYNAAASQIAMTFGARGPIIAISTACSSGAQAIGEAYRVIKYGDADCALAGGAEAPITFLVMRAWDAMRVLASGKGDPQKACRPFSGDREGLVLGEGAGVVMLEEFEHAMRRDADIYGEIIGYGSSSDASHITNPTVEGPARAMKKALQEAGIDPSEVDYLNAHGSGTKLNDPVETQAIKSAFGNSAYRLAISSTKSMHGHTLGAGGAIEMIASLLALKKGMIPPTANYSMPDPQCDLDYVPNQARAQELNVVVSNSFAFGGINAVLVARAVRK